MLRNLALICVMAVTVLSVAAFFILDQRDGDEPGLDPLGAAVDDGAPARRTQESRPEQPRAAAAPEARGRVVGPAGGGSPDVRVLVRFRTPAGEDAGVEEIETRTDTGGRFRLELPERVLVGRLVAAGPGESAPLDVEFLAPGEGVVELGDLVLAPGGRLSGRVVDDDGRGVAGARVVAAPLATSAARGAGIVVRRGLDHDFARSVSSGEDGTFVVSGLPHGEIGVAVSREGFVPDARTMSLRPGSAPPALELALRRVRSLAGRVSADGGPVPFATVELHVAHWRPADAVLAGRTRRVAVGDAAGRFAIPDLAPRRFRATVNAPGYLARRDLEVDARDGRLDVTLVPAGRVLVRLHGGERGGGVIDATISPSSEELGEGAPLQVLRGREAEELLGFEPGPDEYLVAGLQAARCDLVVTAPGRAGCVVAIEGLRPREVRRIEIGLDPEATLEGAVLTFDARPVEGAIVEARRLDRDGRDVRAERALVSGDLRAVDPLNGYVRPRARSLVTSRTDGEGRFRIEGLWPGRYRLTTRHSLQRPAEPADYALSAGEALRDVEVLLPPSAGVSGRVIGPDGRPVPGALVVAARMRSDGRAVSAVSRHMFMETLAQVRTGVDGTFHIGGLSAGTVEVRADPPEVRGRPAVAASSQPEAVRLRAGRDARVELRLERVARR